MNQDKKPCMLSERANEEIEKIIEETRSEKSLFTLCKEVWSDILWRDEQIYPMTKDGIIKDRIYVLSLVALAPILAIALALFVKLNLFLIL